MNRLIKVAFISTLLMGGTTHYLFAQEEADDEESKKVVPIDKKYETEVSTLAKKSAVQSAFKLFTEWEPQTKKTLVTLTEIPSPPFKETERAKAFAALMKEAGADSVWIDEVGNVLATRKGRSGKKTVVVEAHLDTVFPAGTDVKVKQKGDTLYAPGVGDDTRGLTAVITVLKALKQTNIQTDANILFVGAVGEEGLGDLRGVKHLLRPGGPKIDAYIAVDGDGYTNITHRGLGSHRYRITFKGPGGHSYGAFGIVNPHGALGKAIYHFTTEADKFTKEGVKTTYSVSVIGGGTSVNAIPYESWMEVDMRSESPEKLKGIDALLQDAVQRALKEENAMKRRGPDLTVDVKLVGDRPSGRTEPTMPIVQRAMAASKYLQGEPRLSASSTNANGPFSKGIPAITIGSGGTGNGAHSLNEWWLNDKGVLGLQRILLVLLAEAGIAN
ncbi:M20/M25/M40 family metallo-hydrolase [Spirosoma panaciterrae]|uniref:M20/M25/M40 family metallo-hydrolase n=1 Tax=Spirosoma panaciterrae TaxID=496058 RepID=UPI00035F005E|nr:M20/M25/M40 family metallo-hydrolase [Spirosoma panaciterrae]